MPIRRLVCLLALALPSAARAAEVPPLTGPVNDHANVLTAKEREDLTTLLLAQEKDPAGEVAGAQLLGRLGSGEPASDDDEELLVGHRASPFRAAPVLRRYVGGGAGTGGSGRIR